MTDEAETDPLALPDPTMLDILLGEMDVFDEEIEANETLKSERLAPTDVEVAAESGSLAELHYRRRRIVKALSKIANLFEGAQVKPAEAKRKQHRQMVATMIAREQNITGDKIESMLERLANNDPRHLDFCAQLDAMQDRYYLARNALLEMQEQIRLHDETLRIHTAEIRASISGAGVGA